LIPPAFGQESPPRIDYRWGAGDRALLRKYAGELVALGQAVILAGVGATYPALQQASRSVPIVFAQIDPVGAGVAEEASLRIDMARAVWEAASRGHDS
jgi:ABC-type uncharacterized transport system substrate-binding protein